MVLARLALWLLVAVAISVITGPATAQTLVYARGSDSLTLDPAMATSSEDFKIADWAFDGLVKFKGESTEIEPALAESWERSPDGLVWTFRLRKNVKFHDGTPFTADAVKVSFERQFKKDSPAYTPRFVRWAGKLGDMTEVEKVDDYTVKLHFTAPQPALLYNLAIYPAYIVSPAAIAKDASGLVQRPVGTGPFRFVRWEKNNLIELVRNDDYWLGPAKLERVVVRVIPENDVRLLALQKGEVHLTDDVPFNRIADLEKQPDIRIHKIGAVGFSSLNLNVEKKPLQDIRVRKAISHAINRDRMYKITFFQQGLKGDQPMPPGYMGHANDVAVYEYDPKKARQLLAEAGYANGLELKFLAFANPRPYFPSPTDGIAIIQADLAAAGIKAVVSMATWSDWIDRRRKGDFDITISGWTASTVDPDGVLYPYYHSAFIGYDNVCRFKNPEVDQLLEKARSTYDSKGRDELYKKASKIVTDEAISVFFAHPIYTLGMRANVVGAFRNPANQVSLHQVSLK